jgi:Raf kinase inhibitor-like YbhB/YbcL family protein
MLEKLPSAVGRLLRGARAGMHEIVYHDEPFRRVPETIVVESSAFADGQPIPARFTADGDGCSPPIAWRNTPAAAAAIVLLIEDADSPTPEPLVHAIVWDLPGADGQLADSAMADAARDTESSAMGLNSYMKARYLPPDPPPGHGPHRYAFQVYALAQRPEFSEPPGRGALVEILRAHILARGCLVGTYERP